jgi:hypothetical protein
MADSSIETRMAYLEGAFEQIRYWMASIDGRFAGMDARFSSIDARFSSIDARFSSIDARLIAMDARFDALDRKIDQRFMWTIGVVLGSWLTTILAIFLHH